jgi:D-alanyl-D-alanine carboxypeptidase (penicillin-binding protein 5/6)
MIRILVAMLIVAVSFGPSNAFETEASGAYVLDVTTGTVLLNKNGDQSLPPASMSKLMTLYMLFDALRDGRVQLDQSFAVSTRAKNMGGSTMFLNELDRPTAKELIQGIIVSSGNDATVTVAEGLAGTEEAFARQMNEVAPQIGLQDSTFTNASGWPDPNHRMSMRDLARVAQILVTEFPEYYGYFAQEEFDYKDRSPANRFNRNPVLKLGIGADGLKTGHTQEAGYGFVGSARQGDRRIVFAITGLPSQAARSSESAAIVNWAFGQFAQRTIVKEGQQFAQADVWMGSEPNVGLVAAQDQTVLLPVLAGDSLSAEVVYSGPLNAPIRKGDQLAELVFTPDGLSEIRIPLVADREVARGGFLSRMTTAIKVLLEQINQGPKETT